MAKSSLRNLKPAAREQLLKFVCSFAWTDLDVAREEREYVFRLLGRLDLDDSEVGLVEEWLDSPPEPEEVDPADVPLEHRELFLDEIRGLIAADLQITEEERDSLDLLEQLLE
ncbi:MAG: TerB family tellurite resistance protein [Planctomycetota bacterium]